MLRSVRSSDSPAVIALIDGVYREYGDQLCLDNADSDLLELPDRYTEAGGEFVVLEQDGVVRGTHAALPLREPAVCTFRRLYLGPELRGSGWGERLMDWAVQWARHRQFHRIEFWSDTRFQRAHVFFARQGFQRDGRTRQMHDGLTPYQEHFFYRDL